MAGSAGGLAIRRLKSVPVMSGRSTPDRDREQRVLEDRKVSFEGVSRAFGGSRCLTRSGTIYAGHRLVRVRPRSRYGITGKPERYIPAYGLLSRRRVFGPRLRGGVLEVGAPIPLGPTASQWRPSVHRRLSPM